MGGGGGGWGALITIAWWAGDSNPIRSLLTEVEECTACFKYDSFIAYRG